MSSNIDPTVWGNAGWTFLRNIAKGYPDKPTILDKERYKKYFEMVGYVLPCSMCRNNYRRHWKEIPITNYLKDKNQLYKWVNIIKSKSSSKQLQIKNQLVNDRILRIKKNRVHRAKHPRTCARCGSNRKKNN